MTALCVLSPRVLASRLSAAASLHRRLLLPARDERVRKPRHTQPAGFFHDNRNTFRSCTHARARQHSVSHAVAASSSGADGTGDADDIQGGGNGEDAMTSSGDSGSGVPNDFGNFNKVASSVAAERNKGPIADVIVPYLSDAPKGSVLVELACGTGQHAAHLAPLLPHLAIQPTDLDDTSFDAVRHYMAGHPNVNPPIVLDASADWAPGLLSNLSASAAEPGGGGAAAAVLVVNMTHIAPYAATLGMMKGAGAALHSGGLLFVYGPFKRGGEHTSEGNATFDASLRGRNPEWGYRDVEAMEDLAAAEGMATAVGRANGPAGRASLRTSRERRREPTN